jgi:lysophospholipase L1-like esterase
LHAPWLVTARRTFAGAALLVVAAGCARAGEAADSDVTLPQPVPATAATRDSGPGPAAGGGATAVTTTTTLPDPRQVTGAVAIVGDSLTVGGDEELIARAAAHGFTLEVNARDGRRIGEGVAEIDDLEPGYQVLVVALGTNDATHPDFPTEDADALIDKALAAVDPAVTVLWVNVYRDPDTGPGEAAATFNDALDGAVDRYPNLVPLDWAAWVGDHGEVVADDRLHLNDAGYQARAVWLAAAIAEYLPAAG